MAKILVLTFTNMPGGVLDAFRQGFVEALAKEGNEVRVLRSNDFLADYQNSNLLDHQIDGSLLLEHIAHFNPDAVFSMNHSGMFPGLEKVLQCPIGVWLLDGPSYLVDQTECRRQSSRYQMFMPVRVFAQDLIDGFGFNKANLHYLPFASDFQSTKHPFERNIAFIGTFFTGWRLQQIIERNAHDRSLIERIRRLIDSYAQERDLLFAERLARFDLEGIFTEELDEAYVLNTIAINRRIRILDSLENLGLTVFGTSDWPSALPFSSGLAMSFDPSIVVSRKSLENVYNRSKININVSHAQARGGLPWRIFDVMACNGALVSDEQEDLHLLFGDDVEIPIYQSAAEAREICEKLLTDEKRREELVLKCQAAIEKAHRFKHRIQSISKAINVNLCPGGRGNFTFINAVLFKNRIEDAAANIPFASKQEKMAEPFCLQIFQSRGMAFDPDNSLISHIPVSAGETLEHSFVVPDSLPYLRLDIGEHFSKHSNVSLTIAPAKTKVSAINSAQRIDLTKDILASNQFVWDGEHLDCGFDSFCVFKNPFAGTNVAVHFKSIVEERI